MRLRFHTQTAAATLTKAQPRQQRRPDRVPGAQRRARRHPVAAHQRARRGVRDPVGVRDEDRAADAADHRRRDARDEHDRPAGRLLVRRVADRPHGGGHQRLPGARRARWAARCARSSRASSSARSPTSPTTSPSARRRGELPVIGVNRYVDEGEDHKVEVHKIDPETEQRKIGHAAGGQGGARRGRRARPRSRSCRGRARRGREPDAGHRSTPSRRRRRWARSSTRSSSVFGRYVETPVF